MRKFFLKHNKNIIATRSIWREFFNLNKKDQKSINFKKLKLDKDVLKTIYLLFKKEFYDNEALKSLEYTILSPIIMKENDTLYEAVGVLKKKEFIPKMALVFASYDPKKKEFIWFKQDFLKNISKEYFENASFVNYNYLKNVTREEANYLAVWFRACFYESDILYNVKSIKKKMNTNNLIIHDIEVEKEHLIIFSLADIGYKDPKYNDDMSGKIGLFRMSYLLLSNKSDDKKKSHKSLIYKETVKKSKNNSISKKSVLKTYNSLCSQKTICKKKKIIKA